jgi:hypothetical protein
MCPRICQVKNANVKNANGVSVCDQMSFGGLGRMIIEVGSVREPPLQLHKHNPPRAGGACVPTV